jgi:hypothetical protein
LFVTFHGFQCPEATSLVNLHLEFSKVCKGDVVISHKRYSLFYKEEYEQSSRVYELTKAETTKAFEQTNQLMADQAVR